MPTMPFGPEPPEPANPYAPPVAPIGEAPAVPDGDLVQAEATRRKYLNHEANVLALGSLHYVGAVFAFLGAPVIVVAWVGAPPGNPDGYRTIFAWVSVVYAVVGLTNAALGAGLRRLRPWARWAEMALVGLSFLMNTATIFSAAFLPNRPPAAVFVGLPMILAILGYVLYLMLSNQGAVVFSAAYQEVVAQTPHLCYRTGWPVWCLLLLFVVVVALAVLGVGG